MVVWHGILKIKPGKRDEYIDAIKSAGLIDKFLNHPGNIFYEIGKSITDKNALLVCDAWETKDNFIAHDTSADVDIWRELYSQYVINCDSHLIES